MEAIVYTDTPPSWAGTRPHATAPTVADWDRFWAKVDKTTTCWLWTAGCTNERYGQFRLNGRGFVAHRVAYEWCVGPVPDDRVLDHLCRVRRCVNPAHLEPVTESVNSRRSPIHVSALGKAQTHCKRGHEFTPENTHTGDDGRRQCKACWRWHREQKAARRASGADHTVIAGAPETYTQGFACAGEPDCPHAVARYGELCWTCEPPTGRWNDDPDGDW